MPPRLQPVFLAVITALGAGAASSVSAQQPALPVSTPPVEASAENSRLRQMETLYQQQLRNRHVPVLSRYITELQTLADTAPDPEPYRKEISRVQAILSSGGVMDLTAAVQALKTPADTPVSPPMPPPVRKGRAVLALTPALAHLIHPTPEGTSSPEAAAVGEIDWRLQSLPAGTYDVVMNYACPKMESPMTVTLTLGGERLETILDSSHVTPSATAYGLLKLGQLTVHQDSAGENLHFSAGGRESRQLLLRQLVITRARSATP